MLSELSEGAHAKTRRREDFFHEEYEEHQGFLETAVLRRFIVDEPSRLIRGVWRVGEKISHKVPGIPSIPSIPTSSTLSMASINHRLEAYATT